MSGARVLVVDDEPQILRALELKLRNAGYAVDTAATAKDALAQAAMRPPEAVILDLLLPDGSGTDVARELRRWSSAPILVLSAVGEEKEKIAALDAGADDYVTKPFSGDELLARLRAALRRTAPPGDPVLEIGELRIDREKRTVTMRGRARRADADRVGPPAPARGERGQAADASRDPARDLGTRVSRGVELPPRLRLAPAPQDRARSRTPALPAQPARGRLPARQPFLRSRRRLLKAPASPPGLR